MEINDSYKARNTIWEMTGPDIMHWEFRRKKDEFELKSSEYIL